MKNPKRILKLAGIFLIIAALAAWGILSQARLAEAESAMAFELRNCVSAYDSCISGGDDEAIATQLTRISFENLTVLLRAYRSSFPKSKSLSALETLTDDSRMLHGMTDENGAMVDSAVEYTKKLAPYYHMLCYDENETQRKLSDWPADLKALDELVNQDEYKALHLEIRELKDSFSADLPAA